MRGRISAILVLILLISSCAFAQTSKSKSKSKKPPAATKAKSSKSQTAKARQRKRALTAAQQAKLRRLQKAFVASSELKPMAKQLLEVRSKVAYDAVEKFALKHKDEDAGGLAYLLLGYARITDKDPNYDKAVADLTNAKPHARDLADYVQYFLAQASMAKGDAKQVTVTLDKFVTRYPDSLLRRDAALLEANALMSLRAHEEAADVLEAVRTPTRADIEFALGKARRAMGENENALASFRTVYYGIPLAPEADDAGAQIKQLVPGGPYGTLDERKQRAELLMKGRQYAQAAVEYRQLASETPNPQLQIALASALTKLNRDAEAKQVLFAMDANALSGDTAAHRLYLLAEASRDLNDDAGQEQYVQQMMAASPTGSWTQEALQSAGNKFLLRRDFENAIKWYDLGWRAGGKTQKAATLHWRCAWLNYRLNRFDEAKRLMEEQVQLFAFSNETANSLYWLGRIAENESRPTVARAYYAKLTERYPNYYYSLLANDRLSVLGSGEKTDVAFLERISAASAPRINDAEGDADNIRLQKAKLLANAALYDLAIKELQSAAADPDNDWANAEMIRLYEDAGKPFQALRKAKQTVPSYFAAEPNALPKTYVEALFPRPYWDELYRSSTANGLDPYLVASLIRQESEFNPTAISHANAYGLMQLLPEVGKATAKQIKLRNYSLADLLEPNANLKLGTKYFKSMIDEYGGQVEYALAAYNAGTNRVADWRANGTFKDMPEFVESIPFTETREYVQAILRNRAMYKKIYEGPNGTKVAAKAD
ncbi:MAG TPA: transglycosylase SLT domain-containing protein [Terriglobales bacterium]|nr:transglycosylase SLT domain-containing protein [Terriglobales bacterium]